MTATEDPATPLQLAYRDHPGSAPAVVALHGLASNARWWDLVAARLPQRVVAPDLRGHGGSPSPPTGYGFDAVAGDVVALLDRLEVDRVAVAGHSWGASVALTLAAAHPERVVACVLVDGGLGSLRGLFPGGWAEAEAGLRPPDLVGVRPEQVTAWAAGALAEGSDASTAAEILMGNFESIDGGGMRPRLRLEQHMEIARELYELDGDPLLERVRVPIVAVLAENSDPVWMTLKREAVERAQGISGAQFRAIWVRGGHDLPVQRPDAVARAIATALGD